MRLIDADELIAKLHAQEMEDAILVIKRAPTAIVTCGECKHRLKCLISGGGVIGQRGFPDNQDGWYCADGERIQNERD